MPSTAANPTLQKSASPVIHVVAGLIRHPRKKHKIFFTRRKLGQHLENLWEFPGGKLEHGESRFHALKRELDEETGIDVVSAQPLHAITHHYTDKSILLDVWEVLQYKGKPHGREGQESLWLKPDEIKAYSFPEADEPVLSALNLPERILITPELSGQDEQKVLLHFSLLMKQRRYLRILFRSHAMSDKAYHSMAEKLREIALVNGAELIIHRPALDSLQQKHFDSFPYRHLSSSNLRRLDNHGFDGSVILSASCHNENELRLAQQTGCEFALLSAVRVTHSHPGFNPIGWYGFNRMSRAVSIPLYALGGMQRKDFLTARYQGAIGVAGIGDFWQL